MHENVPNSESLLLAALPKQPETLAAKISMNTDMPNANNNFAAMSDFLFTKRTSRLRRRYASALA
jgi:hypothetical protein